MKVENTNMLASIIQRMPLAYVYLKCSSEKAEDYIIQETNPTFEKMVGVYVIELLGKKMSDVMRNYLETDIDWAEIFDDFQVHGMREDLEHLVAIQEDVYAVTAFSPQRGELAVFFGL